MYKRLKLSARIIAKCQKRGEFVSDLKISKFCEMMI